MGDRSSRPPGWYHLGTGTAEYCRDGMHQPDLSLSGGEQMFAVAILLYMYCLASETRRTRLEDGWADGLLLTVAVCLWAGLAHVEILDRTSLRARPGSVQNLDEGPSTEKYQGIVFQLGPIEECACCASEVQGCNHIRTVPRRVSRTLMHLLS